MVYFNKTIIFLRNSGAVALTRYVCLAFAPGSTSQKELKLRFSFVSFKTLNRKLTFKACNPKNSDYIPYKYN